MTTNKYFRKRVGSSRDWTIVHEIIYEKSWTTTNGDVQDSFKGYNRMYPDENIEIVLKDVVCRFLQEKFKQKHNTIKVVKLYYLPIRIEDYTSINHKEYYVASLVKDDRGVFSVIQTKEYLPAFQVFCNILRNLIAEINHNSLELQVQKEYERNSIIREMERIEMDFSRLMLRTIIDHGAKETFIEMLKEINPLTFQERKDDWIKQANEIVEEDALLSSLDDNVKRQKKNLFYFRNIQKLILENYGKRIEQNHRNSTETQG